MADLAPFLECRFCRTRQRLEVGTDGHGNMVERLACGCNERRKAGICLDCPKPVEGRRGVALRCAECKKEATNAASRRYRKRHPERIRATYDASNAQRRTPEGRARQRLYEQEHRAKPEIRERIRHQRRERRVKNPELKREQHRRYKAKYPEKVKAQQDRANQKRAAAKREYMHLYCTKYVGEGKQPVCRRCGAPIPWSGKGRPRLDCEECREAKKVRVA